MEEEKIKSIEGDEKGEEEKHKPEEQKTCSNMFNFLGGLPNFEHFWQQIRHSTRPMSEFLNPKNFKTAGNMHRLSTRFSRNIMYFRCNYLCIFVILMSYILIKSPHILIAMGVLMCICYKIRRARQPIMVFGKQFNRREQFIVINLIAGGLLYFLGAAYILSCGLGASFLIICVHAAFYNIDLIVTESSEELLEETEV